jgi:hypothetical protein
MKVRSRIFWYISANGEVSAVATDHSVVFVCWFWSPQLNGAFGKHRVHCVSDFLYVLQCLFKGRSVPSDHKGVLACKLDPFALHTVYSQQSAWIVLTMALNTHFAPFIGGKSLAFNVPTTVNMAS